MDKLQKHLSSGRCGAGKIPSNKSGEVALSLPALNTSGLESSANVIPTMQSNATVETTSMDSVTEKQSGCGNDNHSFSLAESHGVIWCSKCGKIIKLPS